MTDEIPESVKKCISIIHSAQDDTQKFAALFMVTKLVKSTECNERCRKLLFDGIEFSFLKRLLLCSDIPVDCSPFAYKSIGVSVLSTFCCNQEIAVDPQILSCVSVLFNIIQDAHVNYTDNVTLIKDTYECLLHLVMYEPGKKVLFDAGAVPKISRMCSHYFWTDEALRIVEILIERFGPNAWGNDVNSFNALLDTLSDYFKNNYSKSKFKLCSVLISILYSSPKEVLENKTCSELWLANILTGVNDILSSKIVEFQRTPALILASQMITMFGVEWTFTDDEQPNKFFLLLIQLSSVELRMQLEDRTLDQIMENASLVTACSSILEVYISYIIIHSSELMQKEQQQVFRALKEAFNAIVSTIDAISKSGKLFNVQEKLLIYAIVRTFSGWLAQETLDVPDNIYSVLPFIFQLATESFCVYKSKITQQFTERSNKIEILEGSMLQNINLMRLLLPALCQISMEIKGRQVVLQQHQDEILHECLVFYWSVIQYKKSSVSKSTIAINKLGQENIVENNLIELNDSRTAIIIICNIFMNFIIIEPSLIAESATFDCLSKFIFNSLPELKNTEENLVLYGNMTILGLSLLSNKWEHIETNRNVVSRYIEYAILFLWDAFCVQDDVNEGSSVVLTVVYSKYWVELEELWYLGMRILSSLLSLIPWLAELIMKNGCLQKIMNMLKKVNTVNSLPPDFKSAVENFLCNFSSAGSDAKNVLKNLDALSVCRNHKFSHLSKSLFGISV